MRARHPVLFALMTASALALARPAPAASYLVKPDGTGDFPTIAAAVAAASDYDIIELADGVFSGPGNYNVWINGKTVLIGSRSHVASSCVIDPGGVAGESRRAFIIINASLPPSLTDLTIRHAVADVAGQEGYGGAIFIEHASPVIENCIFEENEAQRGGAIWLGEGTLPQIIECRFEDNRADESGGAVMLGFASSGAVISECTFVGNIAPAGGAISCWNANSVGIWTSTFYGNSATGAGGAHLYARWDALPLVFECILAASPQGSAVFCEDGTAIPQLYCSDIWGNAGGDWTDCIAGTEIVDNNLHADPLFCDGVAGNYHLQAGSPCAAVSGCVVIGAYEVGCTTIVHVCCLGEACYMLEESDCTAIGGIFITDPLFPSCDPDPCPVDAEPTTWGGLKRMFIEPGRPE
jgi:hypothetical protein